MQITRYTDYAMRLMMYLAIHDPKRVTIAEVAKCYGISRNHLMKVAQLLSNEGYITGVRGKHGGLHLACSAQQLNVGKLVRLTEQHTTLVDCFTGGGGCLLTPACHLKNIFANALEHFFTTLDQYTLADLVTPNNRPALIRLLGNSEPPPPSSG